jgi:LacI family repressor for deo operon, udp, cdd, tsx, nupC, and nupG
VPLGDTQHDEEREDRYALMLKRKEADGLIVLGHRLPKESRRCPRDGAALRAGRQRLRALAARILSAHDNAKAAAEAMDHLYCPATSASASSPGRWSARSAAIARAARPPAPSSARRSALRRDRRLRSSRRRRRRAPAQRREPPTAIFCFNDDGDGRDRDQRRGLRILADLSVVGFDLSASRAASTRR